METKRVRFTLALTLLWLSLINALKTARMKPRIVQMVDIIGMIRTPLGSVLMLVVTLVLAGLTVAAAISGELTAAAVSAAGLLVVVFIIAMVNYIGKA